jgi:hypothetical protein
LEADWAVFEVDRVVKGRTPLIVNYTSGLDTDRELALSGHPNGLPLKLARDGFVADDAEAESFGHSLDAYGGNSGSPIVDYNSGVVVGIHAKRPYWHFTRDTDDDGTCAMDTVCSSTTGCSVNFGTTEWARATRIEMAAGDIPLHAALTMVVTPTML